MWVTSYEKGGSLSQRFNIGEGKVTTIIDGMLPHLLQFFSMFIPNGEWTTSEETSSLSAQIRYVVDATITPTTKPGGEQHLSYSGHYQTHGILTHVLVSYDEYIVAVQTGVKGSIHDALFSMYNETFQKICQDTNSYSVGDTGFQAVPWVASALLLYKLQAMIARFGIKLPERSK